MTPPAVVRAERCRCGYLTIQLGEQAAHILPPEEAAAAADRIRDAHSTDDRFKPPPDDYRLR